MKSLLKILGMILIASPLALHAQILWGSAVNIDLSDPTQVADNYTYVDALQLHTTDLTNAGGGATQTPVPETVNNVVFNTLTTGSGDAYFSISNGGFAGDGSTDYSTPYAAILSGTAYQDASSLSYLTVTIGSMSNPLVVGQEYQVQVWDAANYGRAAVFSGVDPVTLNAQFAIGTFTATTTTESFAVMADPVSGSPYAEINAISLEAVPESSTYAMMIGGLAILGFLYRRQRATAKV